MSDPTPAELPASVLALPDRQRRFVIEYLANGGNAVAAATEAGYKGAYSTRAEQGHRLLKSAKITRALSDLTTQQLAPKIGSARWVLKRLEEEASDANAFAPNKTRALDLLGKYLGLQRDPTQTALLEAQIEEKRVILAERRLALEEKKIALEKARLELAQLRRVAEGGGVPTVVQLAWVDEPKVEEVDP